MPIFSARKFFNIFLITAILCSNLSLVFAQVLDTTTEPATEPIIAPETDTVPPGFVSILTLSLGETDADIVWTTDELAYGYVEYGETASYGQKTPKSTDAALEHLVSIAGLSPGTVYHYRIVAEDTSGNISYSEDRTLETALEIVAVDNVPPEISEISVTDIATSSATISWVTDELAQGRVEYGKTSAYGKATPLASDYAMEHSVSLANLEPDTVYHYRVVVQDESANEAVSPDELFTTEALPPPPAEEPAPTATATSTATSTGTTATSTPPAETTTPLSISEVETISITTSTATISWSTNEAANAQVFYGPNGTYASSSALSAAMSTSHKVKLTGLRPGTNYLYKVVSKDASGEIASESGFEFNTLYHQKIIAVAPVISNAKVESVGTSTAAIIFGTDIPATGIVHYGTTTGYEETDGGHTALLTAHRHPLAGLMPDTLYHFQIVTRSVDGSETIYEDATFRTTAAAASAPPPSFGYGTVSPAPAPAPSPAPAPRGGTYLLPSRSVGKPVVTKAEPLARQMLFVWRPTIAASGLKTVIVKKEGGYAQSPNEGTVLYEGNSGRFTDTGLAEGRKYYYSVFRVNQIGAYSEPLHFAVEPKANEKKNQAKLIAVPPAVQKTPIYEFPVELRQGDENKHVEHLQVVLASEPSLYPEGLITGYFGRLTAEAVKKLQKRYKLPATGVANAATLEQLEKLSSAEIAKDKAAVFEKAFMRDLKLGATGGDVAVLQQFLVNAGVYPEALVTGYFGSLTQSALQRFQSEQNISPASGYFGPLTKKRVLNLIRLRSVAL